MAAMAKKAWPVPREFLPKGDIYNLLSLAFRSIMLSGWYRQGLVLNPQLKNASTNFWAELDIAHFSHPSASGLSQEAGGSNR